MKRLLNTVILLLAMTAAGLALAQGGRVDINRADAGTLATLAGIGPSKAQAIVAYRQEHGPFSKVEDLKKVKGIGAFTLEKNREQLMVKKDGRGRLMDDPAVRQPSTGP